MRKSDFSYDLPGDLIALTPLARRSASRMLYLDGDTGRTRDLGFADLPDLLEAGDLLVLNDTRVMPARLYGRKASGGRVEILIERILAPRLALAHVRASKAPKAGAVLTLDGGFSVRVEGREEDLFTLAFCDDSVEAVLAAVGHVPLPPYIDRLDDETDRDRYQTVFAKELGAVAAPTAGLHFDTETLGRIAAKGVATAFVTLHVGSGTFQPIRADDLSAHRMHREWVRVPPATVQAIAETRAGGGRVIAVGTTVVRSLETAAAAGTLRAFTGETDLFITPGFRFRVVDALVTNFHLPESTLLCLVCAFAGYEPVMAAYRHAVAARYRFFSYGDAMFATRCAAAG